MGVPVPPPFQAQLREREDAVDAMLGLLTSLRTHALEIAQHRRTMYLAHVEAGFTEAQALELSKSIGL